MKKFWNKYKNLFWYVVITFVILWFVMEFIGFKHIQESDNYIWGILLSLDTATAIALSVLAFLTYLDYAKSEDEIQIVLEVDGKEYRVDKLKLLRKFFTRGEILGVLGMIQNDSTERFDFKYLSNFEFLEQINEVQKGKKDKMIIKLNRDEFNKFFSKYFETRSSYE